MTSFDSTMPLLTSVIAYHKSDGNWLDFLPFWSMFVHGGLFDFGDGSDIRRNNAAHMRGSNI